MEYLWVWADAVVFRSWYETAVKFYFQNDVTDTFVCEKTLNVYHDLQNKFAGQLFDVLDDEWIMEHLKEHIDKISFEILRLDAKFIWYSSFYNTTWQWPKWVYLRNGMSFLTARVPYVDGPTLDQLPFDEKLDFKLKVKFIESLTCCYKRADDRKPFYLSHYIAHVVTKRLQELYKWTFIDRSTRTYLDRINFKYKIENRTLHLVLTDILNQIYWFREYLVPNI